jgi:hypothetical protein
LKCGPLDGDIDFPTLCRTGTEDYIGTAYGQGVYSNADQGCPLEDKKAGCYGFYRYHVVDPVYFHESIRVTIQQIGCWAPETREQLARSGRVLYEAGRPKAPVDLSESSGATAFGLFERQDDWSCCTCFYLNRCTSGLPDLMEVALRVKTLPDASVS